MDDQVRSFQPKGSVCYNCASRTVNINFPLQKIKNSEIEIVGNCRGGKTDSTIGELKRIRREWKPLYRFH